MEQFNQQHPGGQQAFPFIETDGVDRDFGLPGQGADGETRAGGCSTHGLTLPAGANSRVKSGVLHREMSIYFLFMLT
jgi:hypothetical protein